MSIPAFSVKRKVTITMLILIVVVVGFIAYTKLGLELLPDIEYPQVTIITSYSGASPKEVEQLISKPIEEFVSTVTNVKDIKSVSQEGISIVTVEFEWGTNLDFAAQDIRDRISRYRKFLPEEAEDPLVLKFSISDFPILFYGVTSKTGRDEAELRDIVEDEVADRISRIEGVASALVFSVKKKEVKVTVFPDRLKAYGIGLDRVIQMLRAENVNMPAGYILRGHKEYTLRFPAEYKSLEQVKNTIISVTKQGKPIYLKDVADVELGYYEGRHRIKVHRGPGVLFVINKSSGSNTVLVANAVKKELERIKSTLPDDIEFHPIYDQSEMITLIAKRTTSNIIVGGILAVGLIFLFLRSWKPTAAIALSIPLSIIATFIAFYVAGYTLNLITLVGLALGVGMLVDNSVVVIENSYRHLEEGLDPDSASIVGAEEVGMAITASTLTTIAVFFPMIFATGITGKLARALALSVAFSLFASLFVALTIVPMLTSIFFRGAERQKAEQARLLNRFFSFLQVKRMRSSYESLLRKVLRNRTKVLAGVFVLFIISLVLAVMVGMEFMPKVDRSLLLLKIKAPVGTPLEYTDRIADEVVEKLLSMPEVVTLTERTGISEEEGADRSAGSEFSPSGPHEAFIWAKLVRKTERSLSDTEIAEKIRRMLPAYKGVEYQILDVGQMIMGGSIYPVEVNVFGKDLDAIKEIAGRISDVMKAIKGVRDVNITYEKGKPEISLVPKKDLLPRLGLNSYYIGSLIKTATTGTVATRMELEGYTYDVRVRMPKKERENLQSILNFPVVTPIGGIVYLKDLVEQRYSQGPIKIYRENKTRKISVRCNVVGRPLSEAVADIKSGIQPILKNLPPGYFVEFAGQYKEMLSALKTMVQVFLIAVLLVYMVMAAEFEHLAHPFVIMFTIPLALIGVFFFLAIGGKPVSLPVMMGIVMLAGIAVNNGIVMIDYINRLIRKGVEPLEAVIKGAGTRLRPVLITALSTIFGTLPMVFTTSEGAEMRVPLGLTIVGGLTAATFLTLFVIPIIYTYMNRIRIKD